MARPRKVFPDYPRKPHSSGQAVIWLDGRATYLGVFGSDASRQKYEQLRTDRHLGRTGGAPVTPGTLTVADLCARFLAHAEHHYQHDGEPTKQLERVTLTLAVLVRYWETRLAASIDPPALDALLTDLCQPQPCGRCAAKRGINAQAGQRVTANGAAKSCAWCQGTGKRKWSRLYLRHLTGVIKQVWDWAAFHKLIPPHSLRTVRAVRRGTRGVAESPGVRSVHVAVVWATADAAGPVVRDLIQVQYLTGARPEEAIGLTRDRLRTDGILPEVGSFPGVWVYAVADDWNKNAWRGQGRVIFFGPRAQRVLAPYLDRTGYLFSPRVAAQQWVAEAGRRWVERVERNPGEYYSTQSYGRAIKRACKRAGVQAWTPLQLRHLRGSEVRSLYDADHARVVLGHHLSGVTGVYCEPDLFKSAKVMKEIG